MPQTIYEWTCPLCDEETGHFERKTQDALDIVTASHLLMHEDSASQRAIDRARLECTQTECSLGCRKGYNKSLEMNCPKLTDYDKRFLSGVKISLN